MDEKEKKKALLNEQFIFRLVKIEDLEKFAVIAERAKTDPESALKTYQTEPKKLLQDPRWKFFVAIAKNLDGSEGNFMAVRRVIEDQKYIRVKTTGLPDVIKDNDMVFQSGGTYVAPEARGKGLNTEVSAHVNEHWAKQGYTISLVTTAFGDNPMGAIVYEKEYGAPAGTGFDEHGRPVKCFVKNVNPNINKTGPVRK